ncbi:MAG: M6 family metalloprotease domain-containing protein, partial [Clostridia bacterium]|nr:M6 family metalloprotease domain-containing protein [Clostridia bacterium]
MKRNSLKLMLTLALVLFCLSLFAVAAFAVPAAPGSPYTGQEALCRSHPGELVTLDRIPAGQQGGPRKIPRPGETTKDIPLLTLVIGFSDVKYCDDYDWANEIFKSQKSLRAYYTDMSFGKFTFDPVNETSAYQKDNNTNRYDKANDGVIHVKLDRKHENWTGLGPTRLGVMLRNLSMAEAIIDAIGKAADYINFSLYDANGDGMIGTNELALALVFAGYEASAIDEDGFGGKEEKYLWAHAWSIAEMIEEYGWGHRLDGWGNGLNEPTPHGVKVTSYIAIAEQMAEDQMEPISVLAHELGHYLGLPDLYNTVYDTRGEWGDYDVLNASVMASGSWGINPDGGFMPYSMDAWSRYVLGWIEPAEAKTDGDYSVISQSYGAANQDFAAVRIETQNENEYYLLENRQPQKWDAGLPMGYEGASLTSGVILWHVDMNTFDKYTDDNAVNNPDHHPAVMPLYPESSDGEHFTFLGSESNVYVGNPFYDAAYWNKGFPGLGSALNLPIYAREGADTRAGR